MRVIKYQRVASINPAQLVACMLAYGGAENAEVVNAGD